MQGLSSKLVNMVINGHRNENLSNKNVKKLYEIFQYIWKTSVGVFGLINSEPYDLSDLSKRIILFKGPFTRCDFSWVRLQFLIKLQSYSVNSIIDINATHSVRYTKMQSHSEKNAPCEWALRPIFRTHWKFNVPGSEYSRLDKRLFWQPWLTIESSENQRIENGRVFL